MKNVLQTAIDLCAWGYRFTAPSLSDHAVDLGRSLLFAFYK